MNKTNTIEQLLDGVTEVRNRRKGFLTNFFLDYERHALWIAQGDCRAERMGDTFFVVKEEDSFCNVFYTTTDAAVLQRDIVSLGKEFPGKSLVVDLVGRTAQIAEPLTCLAEVGYRSVCQLVRMSRPTAFSQWEENFGRVRYAGPEHCAEIRSLLLTYFDRELEQIPYLEEITALAGKKQVLVTEDEGKVTGFVVFEKNASTLYLRYWFVRPEYRDKHIGGLLLRRFFYEGNDTKRQMLWVVRSNENSFKRYLHYGFKEDGLEDNILICGDFVPNALTTNNLIGGG